MGLAQAGMSGRPVVSVCIANYNGVDVIDGCIASVLAQDCGFPVEIIVHDDASSDGSVQHIRDRYPQVRLLESVENVGFCVANNRMAAVASGKYLVLLNNDAELYSDALATLHKAAQEVGLPAILSLPQYDFDTGELLDIGSLLDPFLNPVPNLSRDCNEVGMVIGACLWTPKVLWDELGGFPEWFGSIGEDLYLCCRARLAGHPVRALPISGYRHWQGRSFGGNRVTNNRLSTTIRRRALSERNKTFVMVMTYPAPMFQLVLPLHLLLLLTEGALLALLKRDASLFRNVYWACMDSLWRERHRLADLRSGIQSARRLGLASWLAVFMPWPHKLKLLCKHGVPSIR